MEVKIKPVELIELFYDLIFVYAISKLTALISEPVGGIVPPYSFFAYLITSFVILQAWLYFTNYVNRYGQWKWYEYILRYLGQLQYNMEIFMISIDDKVTSVIDFIVFFAYL